MLHPTRFVRLAACLSLCSSCASEAGGPQHAEARTPATSASSSPDPLPPNAADERLEPAAARLGAREWDEQDAKLLLSVVLKSMCGMLDDCAAWLPAALDLDADHRVSFSAATHTRLADARQQLMRSGLSARALAMEEWEANAASDLESVSSIGLSREAVEVVLSGLLGRRVTFHATTGGSRAGLSAPGDAYIRELYAQVRKRSAAKLGSAEPLVRDPFATNKGVTLGTATDAPGGGELDTAIDPTCENLGPGRIYCIYERDNYHEWGIADAIRVPHELHVAFAAAARRCEPCQDGAFATGTLRLIRNARGQAMTMCDTSAACDPTNDPRVPLCSCMN